MKKKSLLFAILATTLSIVSLTSCNDNKVTSSIVTSLNQDYVLEDNELTQMVYNEFLKSFPNSTYEDFRLNGYTGSYNDEITFNYKSSTITRTKGKIIYL